MKGLTLGLYPTQLFFPAPQLPLPKAQGIPPQPPLLVTGPCFLPEIKGLSTEISQEGGGDTASPQGLPEALGLSHP